jgi:hypothetical protein
MFDVRKFVRLDVSDKGDAELHVLAGRNPRIVLIESDDERQEAKRQELARQAADTAVDRNSVRDIRRAPSLSYAGANGCGNVFVYAWTANRSEALTVSANQELLQLSTTPRTFDVSTQEQALNIIVHVYERAHGSWSFCSDVRMAPENEETWKAIRGVVTLRAWRIAARVNTPASLRVMVRIESAEFVSPSGMRVALQQPIILIATIPWLTG